MSTLRTATKIEYVAPNTHPRCWTEQQQEDAARYLARIKTLSQIRRFQSLNQAQTHNAFYARNSDALADLQLLASVYDRAVDIIAFPAKEG